VIKEEDLQLRQIQNFLEDKESNSWEISVIREALIQKNTLFKIRELAYLRGSQESMSSRK
jgi:hypothetical protein